MKKLLFILLSAISLTGFAADVHVDTQVDDEQFSILQSEIIVYKVLRDLQDYPQVTSWNDVKNLVIDLYNNNNIARGILDFALIDKNIPTIEKYLEYLGSLKIMQDILCRFVQIAQRLQIEISLVQQEDSFDGWIEIVQNIEDQMEDGVFVQKSTSSQMSKIKPLLEEIREIQGYWDAQVEAGQAFYF